jgi:hypothetical protein
VRNALLLVELKRCLFWVPLRSRHGEERALHTRYIPCVCIYAGVWGGGGVISGCHCVAVTGKSAGRALEERGKSAGRAREERGKSAGRAREERGKSAGRARSPHSIYTLCVSYVEGRGGGGAVVKGRRGRWEEGREECERKIGI